MKPILTILTTLILFTATGQTITLAQFRKSLDSVAALARAANALQDTAINRSTRRVTALEITVNAMPVVSKGALDSLQRISPLFAALQAADRTINTRIDSLVRADSIANAGFNGLIRGLQDKGKLTDEDIAALKAWADEKQKIFNQLFK